MACGEMPESESLAPPDVTATPAGEKHIRSYIYTEVSAVQHLSMLSLIPELFPLWGLSLKVNELFPVCLQLSTVLSFDSP